MGSMKVKSHVNTAGGGIKYATNGLRKNFEGGTLSEQVLSTSRRDRPDAIRYDRCKVVVTIGGPLTETVEQLEAMLRAGMTVARFDFTAGSRSLDQHLNTLKNLRLAQKNTQCLCAVHCALGGNLFATATKAREDTRLVFVEGQTVRFVHRVSGSSAGEREKSDDTTARMTAFENTDVIPVGGGVDLEKLDFLGSFRVGDAVRVRPFLRAGETSAALEVTAVDAREVTCRCLRGAEMAHAVKRLAVDLAQHGRLKTGGEKAARVGDDANALVSPHDERSRTASNPRETSNARPFAFNASDAAVLARFARRYGAAAFVLDGADAASTRALADAGVDVYVANPFPATAEALRQCGATVVEARAEDYLPTADVAFGAIYLDGCSGAPEPLVECAAYLDSGVELPEAFAVGFTLTLAEPQGREIADREQTVVRAWSAAAGKRGYVCRRPFDDAEPDPPPRSSDGVLTTWLVFER